MVNGYIGDRTHTLSYMCEQSTSAPMISHGASNFNGVDSHFRHFPFFLLLNILFDERAMYDLFAFHLKAV